MRAGSTVILGLSRYSLLFLGAANAAANVSEAASQFKAIAAAKDLSHWDALNYTLEGRLNYGLPVSAPCFSNVNGNDVGPNNAECAAVQSGYTDPLFRAPQFGSFMNPQWETCQSTSQQCLLDAANTSDAAAWTNTQCFQGSVSPYYINVRGVSDVQLAFAFSLATGVHLAIKNSGHDYKGRSSSRDSLSLWTYNLRNITYSTSFIPEGCSKSYKAVTYGAGVGWEQAYNFSESNNITVVGGYHQTVGASGGWVMGGGHSILSPNYGLGVDRVVQFKLVTPDGIYRIANECQNPDLFWALRGGGGGTFGVVLESTQTAESQIALQVASIKFNQTATNPQPFLRLVTDNAVKWGQEGWGGHITGSSLINVNPRVTLDEAKASVQDVAEYALSQNGTAVIETLPSWNTFFQKYVPGAQSAVGAEYLLGTHLIPTSNWDTQAGRDAIYNMLVGMLPWANPYIVVGTPFLYNYTEGSTSVTPAWRNSLWHLGMHASFVWNNTLEQKRAAYQIVSNVTQTMRDISPNSGAYFNEGDVYEPNHEQSYWGDNYPRLLSIKKKYDPLALLDCWQCVGWKGAEDPRYSCYLPIVTPQ